VVAWMHPNGIVKSITFPPAPKGGWITGPNSPIEWDAASGEFRVSASGKAVGAVLYQDVCEGRYEPVDGGKPVAKPKCWADWLRIEEHLARDDDGRPTRTLSGDVDKFMHPECLRRKKLAREALARDGSADIADVLGGGK